MRVVVAGLGVQGYKRRRIAGADLVADVDPVNEEARYRSIVDVPLADYDAVLASVPISARICSILAASGSEISRTSLNSSACMDLKIAHRIMSSSTANIHVPASSWK